MEKILCFSGPFEVRRVEDIYAILDNDGHPVVATDASHGPALAEYISDLLEKAVEGVDGILIVEAEY